MHDTLQLSEGNIRSTSSVSSPIGLEVGEKVCLASVAAAALHEHRFSPSISPRPIDLGRSEEGGGVKGSRYVPTSLISFVSVVDVYDVRLSSSPLPPLEFAPATG